MNSVDTNNPSVPVYAIYESPRGALSIDECPVSSETDTAITLVAGARAFGGRRRLAKREGFPARTPEAAVALFCDEQQERIEQWQRESAAAEARLGKVEGITEPDEAWPAETALYRVMEESDGALVVDVYGIERETSRYIVLREPARGFPYVDQDEQPSVYVMHDDVNIARSAGEAIALFIREQGWAMKNARQDAAKACERIEALKGVLAKSSDAGGSQQDNRI